MNRLQRKLQLEAARINYRRQLMMNGHQEWLIKISKALDFNEKLIGPELGQPRS